MKFVDFDKNPEGMAAMAAYIGGLHAAGINYRINDGIAQVRVEIR